MKKVLSFLALILLGITGHAQDYRFGKVSKEEVLEQSHPTDKEANAAVLFREHKVRYDVSRNTGFTLVTEVHERIKIYNKDGFDWATEEVRLYRDGSSREEVSGIKGVTYNIKNGKLVEEKLRRKGVFEEEVDKYNSKTSFTMPAVTEGSVIEYTYTIYSPFLSSIDKMALQYTIPINRMEARIAIPEFLGFQYYFNPRSPLKYPIEQSSQTFNYQYLDSQTKHNGFRGNQYSVQSNKVEYIQNIYSFQKDDIPALKAEAYVGYLPNYAAFLDWELKFTRFPQAPIENFSHTWEGVTRTIYSDGGYQRELGRTNFFEDELEELLEDLETPEKKATAIYNFVKSKVKWNSYYGFLPEKGTRTAYKEGTGNVGDINILLTAMLNQAGLKAYPVLVSSESHGIPLYPTRNGFNYVISAVKLGENIFLLDATEVNAAFGELPSRARNWQGRLIVDNETSMWVDLMPKKKSSYRTVLNLTFEEDLALSGKTSNILAGLYAKSYRDEFGGLNQESYLQNLEKDKGNIVINNLVVKDGDLVGADIKESYDFLLKDKLEEINGRIYFQPLLFEKVEENPFKAEKRVYPIFFDFPREAATTVNIRIPEGYEVESLPESTIVEFKEGSGSYKFLVRQNGPFLRVDSVLEWNGLIYRAEEFENIKNFYNTIVEKNSEAIVLKKV